MGARVSWQTMNGRLRRLGSKNSRCFKEKENERYVDRYSNRGHSPAYCIYWAERPEVWTILEKLTTLSQYRLNCNVFMPIVLLEDGHDQWGP